MEAAGRGKNCARARRGARHGGKSNALELIWGRKCGGGRGKIKKRPTWSNAFPRDSTFSRPFVRTPSLQRFPGNGPNARPLHPRVFPLYVSLQFSLTFRELGKYAVTRFFVRVHVGLGRT